MHQLSREQHAWNDSTTLRSGGGDADTEVPLWLPLRLLLLHVSAAPQLQTHSDAATSHLLRLPPPQQLATRTPQRLERSGWRCVTKCWSWLVL